MTTVHRGDLAVLEVTHAYTLLNGAQRSYTYYYTADVARVTKDGHVAAVRPVTQLRAKARTLAEYTLGGTVERLWLTSKDAVDWPALVAALEVRTGEATFPTLDAARAFLRPFCRVEVAT